MYFGIFQQDKRYLMKHNDRGLIGIKKLCGLHEVPNIILYVTDQKAGESPPLWSNSRSEDLPALGKKMKTSEKHRHMERSAGDLNNN